MSSFTFVSPIILLITGASLTGVIVTVTVVESLSPPWSVAVNVIVSIPLKLAFGVSDTLCPAGSMIMVMLASPEFVQVICASGLSMSVTKSSRFSAVYVVSSGNVMACIELTVGASFTGFTVTRTVWFIVIVLSVTEIVMFSAPLKFCAGVTVAVEPVISAARLAELVAENVNSSSSASVAVKVSVNGVSSSVSWLPMGVSTGAKLTLVRVIYFVSLTAPPLLSSIVMVSVSVPRASSAWLM